MTLNVAIPCKLTFSIAQILADIAQPEQLLKCIRTMEAKDATVQANKSVLDSESTIPCTAAREGILSYIRPQKHELVDRESEFVHRSVEEGYGCSW